MKRDYASPTGSLQIGVSDTSEDENLIISTGDTIQSTPGSIYLSAGASSLAPAAYVSRDASFNRESTGRTLVL